MAHAYSTHTQMPIGVCVCLVRAQLSTGSAECIAVSSLWAYDIYRTYINPAATGKQILVQSRIVVVAWAVVMAISSIVLNEIGVGLGWVYCFMGIWIGSGVAPVACAVYTDKLGKNFAMAAAWLGMVLGLITWITIAVSSEVCSLAFSHLLSPEHAPCCHTPLALSLMRVVCVTRGRVRSRLRRSASSTPSCTGV